MSRLLGQAFWRQMRLHGTPDRDPAETAETRRDQQRIGLLVLRELAEMGITLHKSAAREPGPPATGA